MTPRSWQQGARGDTALSAATAGEMADLIQQAEQAAATGCAGKTI
jgi:hypothetical protein